MRPWDTDHGLITLFVGWLWFFVAPPVLILIFHDVAWWQATKVIAYLWLAADMVLLLESVADWVLTRRQSGPMTPTDDPDPR